MHLVLLCGCKTILKKNVKTCTSNQGNKSNKKNYEKGKPFRTANLP